MVELHRTPHSRLVDRAPLPLKASEYSAVVFLARHGFLPLLVAVMFTITSCGDESPPPSPQPPDIRNRAKVEMVIGQKTYVLLAFNSALNGPECYLQVVAGDVFVNGMSPGGHSFSTKLGPLVQNPEQTRVQGTIDIATVTCPKDSALADSPTPISATATPEADVFSPEEMAMLDQIGKIAEELALPSSFNYFNHFQFRKDGQSLPPAPETTINVSRENQADAEMVVQVAQAIYGQRAGWMIRGVQTGDMNTPKFDGGTREVLLTGDFYSHPESQRMIAILHEALGHGSDPILYYKNLSGVFSREEYLHLLELRMQIASKYPQYKEVVLPYEGTENYFEDIIASGIERAYKDSDPDLLAELQNYPKLAELIKSNYQPKQDFSPEAKKAIKDELMSLWQQDTTGDGIRSTKFLSYLYNQAFSFKLNEFIAETIRRVLEPGNYQDPIKMDPDISNWIAEYFSIIRGEKITIQELRQKAQEGISTRTMSHTFKIARPAVTPFTYVVKPPLEVLTEARKTQRAISTQQNRQGSYQCWEASLRMKQLERQYPGLRSFL